MRIFLLHKRISRELFISNTTGIHITPQSKAVCRPVLKPTGNFGSGLHILQSFPHFLTLQEHTLTRQHERSSSAQQHTQAWPTTPSATAGPGFTAVQVGKCYHTPVFGACMKNGDSAVNWHLKLSFILCIYLMWEQGSLITQEEHIILHISETGQRTLPKTP